MKEHYQKVHGNKHQDCNFGQTHFNLSKRKLKLSPEEAATLNKQTGKGKGHNGGGGNPPPPSTGGCILLDFTGYTVTGTGWNYTGQETIVCSPANLLSTQVDEILVAVTDSFSPFQVVVTTDEAIYDTYPTGRKTRVIFTETWEWYGQAGGTSLIGSFKDGTNSPCFVFTSLLNYNTKYIKEAGSHEAGHTLGLYHQSKYDANCIMTNQYNPGGCPEMCDHAPKMGVAYYQPISDWIIGPNQYGCHNIQDDRAVITSVLGLK